MFTLFLLTLFLGITWGILLLTLILLHCFKIKCPKCKQPKPLQEIILFQWKSRQITGQPCQRCQKPKPQIKL